MILDKEAIPKPLIAAIRACIRGESGWPLLIWGPPGVGKTSAATCLHHDFRVRGMQVWSRQMRKFTREQVDLSMHRLMDGEAPISDRGYWKQVETADLATLDDLDVLISPGKSAVEGLYAFLEARRGKPTLLICNGGLNAVERLYGVPVRSRCEAGTVVQVDGPDRRRGSGGRSAVAGMEDF